MLKYPLGEPFLHVVRFEYKENVFPYQHRVVGLGTAGAAAARQLLWSLILCILGTLARFGCKIWCTAHVELHWASEGFLCNGCNLCPIVQLK